LGIIIDNKVERKQWNRRELLKSLGVAAAAAPLASAFESGAGK
jgi:hypothetical protein